MTYTSPIEILEQRIAPAGVVTISFTGTSLHVDGDAADNSITITEAGPNKLTISPDATTQVKFGTITGAAGAPVQVPGHIDGHLFADLKAGLDKLSLVNLAVGGDLVFTDSLGDNTLSLSTVKVGGGLAAITGAGADAVSFAGAYVFIGGGLTASLGEGTNSLGGVSGTVSVGGAIRYNGGANADSFSFNDTDFHTGGGIVFQGMNGANSFTINGAHTHVGGGISVLSLPASAANDTATINTSGEVIGGINIVHGNGANTTLLGTPTGLFIAGNFNVTGGSGVDTVTASAGALVKIGGSINVRQGAGDDVFNFAPGALNVGGGVTLDAGDGKNTNTLNATTECVVAGVVSFTNGKNTGTGTTNTVSASQSLKVGGISIANVSALPADTYSNSISSVVFVDQGGLTIAGGAGVDTVTITSPILTVTGATLIQQGGGTNNTLGVTVAAFGHLGAFTVKSGAGNDAATFAGGTMTLASLTIEAGDGTNTVSFTPTDGTVEGSLSIANGKTTAGTSITNIGGPATSLLRIGGSLSIVNGDGASSATLGGISRIGGGVLFQAANASAATSFTVNGSSHRIQGGLTVVTGGGADTVTINPQAIHVGGAVAASLGAGDDIFRLNATGTVARVNVDFGSGTSTALVAGGGVGSLVIEGFARLVGASALTGTASLSLFNATIRETTFVKLGDGATTASIDDIHAVGAFALLTGGGIDSINVEQAGTNFESVFDSIVQITAGGGNDKLLIGKATAADRAIFKSMVLLDGGAAADTATVLPGNTYLPGQPVNVLGSFETFA